MAKNDHIVTLASQRGERQLEARREATPSGREIVPAAVRDAGPRAVESYLCFFARAVAANTGDSYRSVTNQFFRWCEENHLALAALNAGHVTGFFEANRGRWAASTARLYFGALRGLFRHLESDGVIERSPAAGAEFPRWTGAEGDARALAELKGFLRDLDGYRKGSPFYRPGQVAMFPVFFGTMDEDRIAAVTGIPREEVATCAGRLRENGVWTEDGKIAVEFEDPDREPELAAVNMVLIIGCAAGVFRLARGE